MTHMDRARQGARKVLRWFAARLPMTLGLLLMATVAGTLGRHHWLLDLVTHFKLHAAMVALFCGSVAGASRRPKSAAIAAVLLLVNAWPLGQLWRAPKSGLVTDAVALPHPHPNKARLTLVSYNVNTANGAFDDVIGALRATQADIIAVLETNQQWTRALRRVDPSYRVLAHPRSDNFGLTVLSRLPVRRWQVRFMTPALVPVIDATVHAEGLDLRIIALHTMPPINAMGSANRDIELMEVAELARTTTEPMVVLGDFNATPWSAALVRFERASGLSDSLQGVGAQPTWPAPLGPLGIPIDHLWHRPTMKTVARRVGAAWGSDHRLVWVQMTVPGR